MRTPLFALLLACMAQAAPVNFAAVPRERVESRLREYTGDNATRQATLSRLFTEAGCPQLEARPAKGSKLPNVVCTLPGQTPEVIVVGAHFDKTNKGDGVADNWSGSALLPSLLESLRNEPRRHTLVFVGFSDEEKGLVGSQAFAKQLKDDELGRLHAMVNMDTLGLGPTKVWVTTADKRLLDLLGRLAAVMQLPVAGVNVEQVGSTDSEPFRKRKVPSITLHSLTQETWPILHSDKDRWDALKLDDYYASYRLLAAYLALLDQQLGAPPSAEPAKEPSSIPNP